MIELRNKKLIIDDKFKHFEFNQFEVFIEDKIVPGITAEEFDNECRISIELNKELGFEQLLERLGECEIENLVFYKKKLIPFVIDDINQYYDWEKLFFPMQSIYIKSQDAIYTIGFEFCLPDEDSFGWIFKYTPRYVLEQLSLLNHNKVNIIIEEPEDDFYIRFKIELKNEFTNRLSHSYTELMTSIHEIEQIIYQTIEGFNWKDDYCLNEPKFTKEVIIPLLKRMNYKNIKYNHGKEEYGRDVIFSEKNKFHEEMFYGIQVKAGDVNGSVNSQVDMLIGQLDDAFNMPITLLGNEEKRYLSVFIIAISGCFKKNAKEKILEKIPKWNKQNVFFWDKDKIEELIREYWKGN